MNSDVAGNMLTQKMLHGAVTENRLHHAVLFHGPAGTGKFTAAMELIRKINCRSNPGEGCDMCAFCHRARPPFPFHPDLKVLRKITHPIIFHPAGLVEQYIRITGEPGEGLRDAALREFHDIARVLEDRGMFTRRFSRTDVGNPYEVWFMDVKAPGKKIDSEDAASSPFGKWFLERLMSYLSSSTYKDMVKIDDIRKIQKELSYYPYEARYRVAVIDDADAMNPAAQNSLLKTLEEPPSGSMLILVTSNPSALLPTIRSRCLMAPFRALSRHSLRETLAASFGFPEEMAGDIVVWSDGSLSRALQMDVKRRRELEKRFAAFFTPAPGEPFTTWVVKTAGSLLALADSGDRSSAFEILGEFYRWLHHTLIHEIFEPGAIQALSLPGGIPLTAGRITKIMDGLVNLMNTKVFHLDLKLQLETLFFEISPQGEEPGGAR